MKLSLEVNGAQREAEVHPLKRLLDLLREEFAMPVEELYPFRKIGVTPGQFDENQLRDMAPRLAIAVGLALRSFD